MIFWACILVGGLFAWLAVKIGFYETLVYLFNMIVSIYVAIFLTPVILVTFPATREMPCCHAMTLGSIAVGAFLVLYGITYVFLTGQFKVLFPKVFDILLAGVFGFVTGFLLASFAALIITITPLSQNPLVSRAGLNRNSIQDNLSYVRKLCDSVHWFVSLPDKNITSELMINELLDNSQSKEQETTEGEIQTNQPGEPNDPNATL